LGLLHDMLCLSYVSKVLFHFHLLCSFGSVRNLHFSFDVLFPNIRFHTSSTNCSLYCARSLLAFAVMLHTFAYTPLCLHPLKLSRLRPSSFSLSLYSFVSLTHTHALTGFQAATAAATAAIFRWGSFCALVSAIPFCVHIRFEQRNLTKNPKIHNNKRTLMSTFSWSAFSLCFQCFQLTFCTFLFSFFYSFL